MWKLPKVPILYIRLLDYLLRVPMICSYQICKKNLISVTLINEYAPNLEKDFNCWPHLEYFI